MDLLPQTLEGLKKILLRDMIDNLDRISHLDSVKINGVKKNSSAAILLIQKQTSKYDQVIRTLKTLIYHSKKALYSDQLRLIPQYCRHLKRYEKNGSQSNCKRRGALRPSSAFFLFLMTDDLISYYFFIQLCIYLQRWQKHLKCLNCSRRIRTHFFVIVFGLLFNYLCTLLYMQHWLSTCKHIHCFILCLYNNHYSPADVMSCEYTRYPSVPRTFLKQKSKAECSHQCGYTRSLLRCTIVIFLSKHIQVTVTRHLRKNAYIKSRCFANARFLQCRYNSVPQVSGSFTKHFLNDQKPEKHDP